MIEFPNNEFHDEDPEHLERVEDLNVAARQIDPNNWISESISDYRERAQELGMGVKTEYDMRSYDNDAVYKDPELVDLQHDLEQKFDAAILAVADLQKAHRATQERRDALHRLDMRAQAAARKILDADEVTVEDIFPSA